MQEDVYNPFRKALADAELDTARSCKELEEDELHLELALIHLQEILKHRLAGRVANRGLNNCRGIYHTDKEA